MRSVLIVGAAGILAPAATTLAGEGSVVTGIGRRRPMPAGVETLNADARDAEALASAIGERRWEAAIVYGPASSPESLEVLRAAVDGRVVVVRTSADADPALGEVSLPDDTLQLGWTGPAGAIRWHSAEAISDAALQVLADGDGRVLGRVRPWEERP
jgi:saccharopine dehydrogenase-like NADP-dependent oxidoreductase